MLVSSSRIVDYAKTFDHSSWVDSSSPGPYCALFVRHVFGHCGAKLPVSSKPSDWADSKHMEQGAAFANSLAGDEIGPKIPSKSMLKPGDLVFWRQTYPEFARSPVITHVGIYAGNDQVVDRGTSGVHYRSIDTFSNFVEGRRPRCIDAAGGTDTAHAPPNKVTKIELVHGRLSVKVRGVPVRAAYLEAFGLGGVRINMQWTRASSLLIEMQDQTGRWYKGYLHDHRCKFIGMHQFVCMVKDGLLAVQIDESKGIIPRSLGMTIVEV